MLKKYLKSTEMSFKTKTNGGVIYLLPDIFLKVIYLLPLIFMWRVVMSSGIEVGMSTEQMISYTYLSSLLADALTVKTAATGWLYEGVILRLYLRPLDVFGQLIAETVGRWFPALIGFSLPMALLAPIFGVNLVPASFWFFPSLLLCISLGFAIDFVFACLTLRLNNVSWIVNVIRMAIVSIFSGAVIPFKLLPFGLGRVFSVQPFASMGGAALSVFTGISGAAEIIPLQLFWNAVAWAAAIILFDKMRERMVSYGG